MLFPMQLQFNIELNYNNELIHMANGTDDGRVVINRFVLRQKMVCMTNLLAHF